MSRGAIRGDRAQGSETICGVGGRRECTNGRGTRSEGGLVGLRRRHRLTAIGPLLKRYPTSMRRKPDHQRSLITKIQYLALAIPPSHRQRLSDPRDRNTLEIGYRDFEYRVHFTLSLHSILDSLELVLAHVKSRPDGTPTWLDKVNPH